VRTFAPTGAVVIGIDDTLERRRGQKIKAKGIYRDPVRSSRSHMVKASGLRWLCAMVLAEISWAKRLWALPFPTALCPSERYHQPRGQRHKPLPQWAGNSLASFVAGCQAGGWSWWPIAPMRCSHCLSRSVPRPG